jgi:hypothetical protein
MKGILKTIRTLNGIRVLQLNSQISDREKFGRKNIRLKVRDLCFDNTFTTSK